MRYLHLLLLVVGSVCAEDGAKAWLRYAPITNVGNYSFLPSSVVALNGSTASPVYTASQELRRGIEGIFGRSISTNGTTNSSKPIIVGTVDAYKKIYGDVAGANGLEEDGFFLSTGNDNILILGLNQRGALYGAFAYLSRLAQGNFSPISIVSNPHAPIRW